MDAVLKVNGAWVHNSYKYLGCLPLGLCGLLEVAAHSPCLASQDSVLPHITRLEKDEDSQSMVST